jgi:hypothetical protein
MRFLEEHKLEGRAQFNPMYLWSHGQEFSLYQAQRKLFHTIKNDYL